MACAAVTIGGVIYNRGRLDSHAKVISDSLTDLKVDLRKAQADLNDDAKDGALLEQRVTAHEQGCEQRQRGIEKRFDKVDAALENINAQVRNVVLDLVSDVRELRANTPAARRRQQP